MRFYGTLIGPQGGQVYKSGTDTLEADVRHDGAAVRIEIRGSIVDGVPHVRVTACGVDSQVVFYSGPIADAATRKTGEREPMVGPFRMTDQACGCGRPLREFEVELGGCTSCMGYHADSPRFEACCGLCGRTLYRTDDALFAKRVQSWRCPASSFQCSGAMTESFPMLKDHGAREVAPCPAG